MTANLDIFASGWPLCPASTNTGYTMSAHVTGTSSSSSTYLWVGIYDYVKAEWVASTEPYIGPYGTSIDVTKSFTITTPSNSGETSYGAHVYYWNWDTSSWVFADYTNSGRKIVGTPSVDAANLVINPSPVSNGNEVTLSWDLTGTTDAMNILTAAYYYDWDTSNWIQIGNYMSRYVEPHGSFTEQFSITHKPEHTGTNYYYVAAWYYDRCTGYWTGWNYEMKTVNVICGVIYDTTKWDGGTKQTQNNCYNYGCDERTDTFAQPGRGSGQMMTSVDCTNIRSAAENDGLIFTTDEGVSFDCVQWTGGTCSHRVALYIDDVVENGSPYIDYHWYREDVNNDGTYTRGWSHKPGGNAARDYDYIGNFITEPAFADRRSDDGNGGVYNYEKFCGYYCVPKPDTITIN